MSNSYYNKTGTPSNRSFARSAPIRDEYAAIEAGFNLLPIKSAIGKGFGEKIVVPDVLISDLDYAVNMRSLLAVSNGLSTVNLSGTSTTSLNIATGVINFVTQAAKDWKHGMFVILSDAANVNNYMFGQIDTYNTTTGAVQMAVSSIGGSGIKTSWILALSGPGAASITIDSGSSLTLSVDTALLNSSTRYQYVLPTADLLSITLPTESGVTRGKPFTFYNIGLYTYFLKNSAGAIIGAVAPNDTCNVFLKGTTSNDWYIQQQTRLFQVGQAAITPTYLNVAQAGAIVANDATTSIVFWADRNASTPFSHTLSVQIYTFNDTGNPVGGTVASTAIAFTLTTDLRTVLNAVKIDANKFICVMTQGDTTGTNVKLRAVVVDISSGTPVFGTIVDIETTGVTGTLDICALNTTTALLAYEVGVSGLRSRILNVSGTTITVNAATTSTSFGTSVGIGVRCVALSTASAFIAGLNLATNTAYGIVATVTGTTITYFSSQALTGINAGLNSTTTALQNFTLVAMNTTDVYMLVNPLLATDKKDGYLIHFNINSNVPFLRSVLAVNPSYSLRAFARGNELVYVATDREGENVGATFRTTFLNTIKLGSLYNEPISIFYNQAFPAASVGGVGRYGNSHGIVNLTGSNRVMGFHNDASDGFKLKVTSSWLF